MSTFRLKCSGVRYLGVAARPSDGDRARRADSCRTILVCGSSVLIGCRCSQSCRQSGDVETCDRQSMRDGLFTLSSVPQV